MKTRVISAFFAILFFLFVLILGSFYTIVITIAVSLMCALLCGEYLSARKLHTDLKLFIPSLLVAFLLPMLSMTAARFVPLYLFWLYLCIASVVFHKQVKMVDIAFTFSGVTLIACSLALMNVCAASDAGHAAFWVTLIVGIPWLCDSGAYFVGSAIGKRKLCPEISPHKTVEGAVGGVVCGTLFPLLLGLVFLLIYGNVTINFAILPLLGLLNSVISIFGDLAFSVVKRSCGIKDYGSIMPGHGGMLDRFDSVIFCVPVIYIFSQFVTIIA